MLLLRIIIGYVILYYFKYDKTRHRIQVINIVLRNLRTSERDITREREV